MNFQSRYALSTANGERLNLCCDVLLYIDLGRFRKVALVCVCENLQSEFILGGVIIKDAQLLIDMKTEKITVQNPGLFVESNLKDDVLELKREHDKNNAVEWEEVKSSTVQEISTKPKVPMVKFKKANVLTPSAERLVTKKDLLMTDIPSDLRLMSSDMKIEIIVSDKSDLIRLRNVSQDLITYSQNANVMFDRVPDLSSLLRVEIASMSFSEKQMARKELIRTELDVNPDLSVDVRKELIETFVEYDDIFWLYEDDCGLMEGIEHVIDTGDGKPVRHFYQPTNQLMRQAINQEVARMLRKGIIREVNGSPWCSSVLGVWKNEEKTKIRIGFRFKCVYKNGKAHCDADCLSRHYMKDEDFDKNEADWILSISCELTTEQLLLKEQQSQDVFCWTMIKILTDEKLSDSQKRKRAKHFLMKDGFLMRTRLTPDHELRVVLVIPESQVEQLLKKYHDDVIAGHHVAWKTLARISSRFYVRNLEKHVLKYVK
ncbi:hypothetical protein HDE_05699 [Halotydeus destructor]|nr:hypothetical protein HDE_05699 [Halotydeus destructor]